MNEICNENAFQSGMLSASGGSFARLSCLFYIGSYKTKPFLLVAIICGSSLKEENRKVPKKRSYESSPGIV